MSVVPVIERDGWNMTVTPLPPSRANGVSGMVRVVARKGSKLIIENMTAKDGETFVPGAAWKRTLAEAQTVNARAIGHGQEGGRR